MSMNSEMKKYLSVLEHLSYILECVILDYTGEAKTELERLCKRIETNSNYQFESCQTTYDGLSEVLGAYQRKDYRKAASILSRITRQTWKMFLNHTMPSEKTKILGQKPDSAAPRRVKFKDFVDNFPKGAGRVTAVRINRSTPQK
jgi:hypothetical protein